MNGIIEHGREIRPVKPRLPELCCPQDVVGEDGQVLLFPWDAAVLRAADRRPHGPRLMVFVVSAVAAVLPLDWVGSEEVRRERRPLRIGEPEPGHGTMAGVSAERCDQGELNPGLVPGCVDRNVGEVGPVEEVECGFHQVTVMS